MEDTTFIMEDTKNQIILIGDIHGEFYKLNYDIKRLQLTDAYLIQCGDTGFGFEPPDKERIALRPLQITLEKNNLHLFMIRGNHCNPVYFEKRHHPYECQNITLLPDYSELVLLGKKILLVGGAISIDRRFRREGESWWSNEEFCLKKEDEFSYKDKQYDLVVTHTRPSICGAFKGFDSIREWCNRDSNLEYDLIEEGKKLNYLYENTKPKYFCYGHFHESLTTTYENTTFKCLNIHEYWSLPI